MVQRTDMDSNHTDHPYNHIGKVTVVIKAHIKASIWDPFLAKKEDAGFWNSSRMWSYWTEEDASFLKLKQNVRGYQSKVIQTFKLKFVIEFR